MTLQGVSGLTTMFVVAQIFGVLGMIASVLSMQFKSRKHIFVALLLVNLFSALNFLCLRRPSSCLIDLLGDAEMVVNNQFERRKRRVPKWLVAFYIALTVLIGVLTAEAKIDYMVVVAAIGFCFTVLMKKEQDIRKMWILVLTLYVIYDVLVGAYVFAVSSTLSVISTIVALVRYRRPAPESDSSP